MSVNSNIRSTNLFLFIISVILSVGIALFYIETRQQNMIEKSKFSYTLIKDFASDADNKGIATDIYNNKKILVQNGGRWTEFQLSDYLGFFELLGDYVDAGTVHERDAYDNFDFDLEAAYNNPEVQAYIKSLRMKYKDPSYYIRFERLAKKFKKM